MDEKRCTIGIISKNAWSIIARELSVQDLIQLRAGCKWLNDVVRSMNGRWFRAHQWFVARKGTKSKVKSAIKCHPGRMTYQCISDKHPLINDVDVKYQRKRQIIADGLVTENDCTSRRCWSYTVPKTEQDVPLGKGYKPKRNIYLYWYLIECYRHKKKKQVRAVNEYNNYIIGCQRDRHQKKREIEWLQKQIKHSKEREEELHVKRDAKIAKNEHNQVFDGVRINNYKGK